MIHNEKVSKRIHSAIKKVWVEKLNEDYENKYLLKEDSLKNAFYFHLRNELGDSFLIKKNLRIYTEYYLAGERVDLVVVQIDPEKSKSGYLGESIVQVVAAVELKYKSGKVNHSPFNKDVEKVMSFIETWNSKTKFYLAFIWEKYLEEVDVVNWLNDEQAGVAKGQVIELYTYWSSETNETVWQVMEH